jgi:hypothetical protein
MNQARKLENSLRRALDARTTGLDAAAQARLRQARARAVASAGSSWRIWLDNQHWVLPAGGFAAVFALVLVIIQPWQTGERAPVPIPPIPPAFLEIGATDVDLELVDDMDFYDWLAVAEIGEDPV